MLKRTLRISTIILCIFCTFFLICTGVFAATRQASQVSTTVQFTPGILAKVFVVIDGDTSNKKKLIFNNTDDSDKVDSTYFTFSGGSVSTDTTNNQTIQFIIENHNETGNIKAEVFYEDEHKGWYFADTNGDEYTAITAYNAPTPATEIQTSAIAAKSGDTIFSGTTNTFHIISLFDNLDAKLVIKLTDA